LVRSPAYIRLLAQSIAAVLDAAATAVGAGKCVAPLHGPIATNAPMNNINANPRSISSSEKNHGLRFEGILNIDLQGNRPPKAKTGKFDYLSGPNHPAQASVHSHGWPTGRCGSGFPDAADDNAIGEHVEVVTRPA